MEHIERRSAPPHGTSTPCGSHRSPPLRSTAHVVGVDPFGASTLMLRLGKCIIILMCELSPPSLPRLVRGLCRPLARMKRGRGESFSPRLVAHQTYPMRPIQLYQGVATPHRPTALGGLVPDGEICLNLRYDVQNAYPTGISHRVGVVYSRSDSTSGRRFGVTRFLVRTSAREYM